ncbi:MAG TPA: tetratricopeptide repeat protein [Thermoanaerobaculia bacterium]|nr:tetratricopeptide repeat protein [Thermoanaerobaculia bacterium]
MPAMAEQTAPRDIFPQAMASADAGDVQGAIKKTNELTETGKIYGLKTYPIYAEAVASLASAAARDGKAKVAEWAAKAAEQLDPTSAGVAFAAADRAADRGEWGHALPAVARGYLKTFSTYRSRVLARSDLDVVLCMAIGLIGIALAITLFFRHGRSASHDFREIIGARVHGGSVTILAIAVLFLPVFLWLGPVWLAFYWFAIFFGYANASERSLIVITSLALAIAPLALDRVATTIANVNSPVVVAAAANSEQSYQPDALRSLQELAAQVPDDATIQLLLGNLQLHEGNDRLAGVHYRRSAELKDSAGAHVNLGNLHFANNDFAAAITEYEKAQKLDPKLAIAFYNNSVASGETYKFDEQGQKLDQAKKIDSAAIERLSQSQGPLKVATYNPPIREAWQVATSISRRGTARSLFGNYAFFDPLTSALNPITIGGLLSLALAMVIWLISRRNGFAGACIKCGRTFCYRCKSSSESATYCTQCIHIYLKRDGVSLQTKRQKLDEVHGYQSALLRRNRILATFMPGSAQILEGNAVAGYLAMLLFLFFVSFAILIGRLAPVLADGHAARLIARIVSIVIAVIIWCVFTVPVYRRKVAV